MTARSRWVIGGSAIFLVILIVAFLGSTRNKSSVQARGIPSDAAGATVAFASPGRVEGASETTQVGAAADGILKAVYVKEDQFVRRGTLLGEIACDDLQASLQTAMAEAYCGSTAGAVSLLARSLPAHCSALRILLRATLRRK